jgi:hypothetical protein
MSQKTYESEFSHSRAFTGMCIVAEKRLRYLFWVPQPIYFGGNVMKNKKLIFAVLALVLVIAAMVGIYAATRPEAVEGEKNVTVIIVYEDGTEKKLEYTTDCETLAELLLEKNLVTGYESQEYGFTIESVDGIMLDWAMDGAYWALYEGDEYAITSAAGITLTEGGIYKLVYERF